MTYNEFNAKWTADAYAKAKETDEGWREYVNDCFEMYEYYGFTPTFHTPYEQMAEYEGLPFKVIGRETEEEWDFESLPAWTIEFEGGVQISALPEEITLLERCCEEYNEVVRKYNGASVEDIRTAFGKDITNDESEFIDTNYKDILVTFNVKDGKCEVSKSMEVYNEYGNFVDKIDLTA